MEYDKNKIADAVKAGRLNKGWSQQELAENSGIALRSVQRIEGAEVQARLYTLRVLGSTLNLELDQLIRPVEPSQRKSTTSRFNFVQRLILSVALFVVLLLATLAFVAQSTRFPETSFEVLVLVLILLMCYTLFLLLIWKGHAKATGRHYR
ncbi:helix-turn-helix domain-containing protein [Pedobacter sp. KR3-3]|uniref:Helix-turn-helix domain-containing protein n=1 Tax=Pedobacter albus TaxID=3113905 RepID=A0ABU7I607_9SPHI|nr:helix-turn-helix domain-containing protein [Pedobacter sp. KR3-3]MEE1944895.1 helix-turn-helix domain-containing protein [Pedobacter sp. KR3-3]